MIAITKNAGEWHGRYQAFLRAAHIGAMAFLLPAAALAQSVPASHAVPEQSAPQALEPYAFVTLGTQGGPLPSKNRSQPANVIVRPGQAYLVDVGDGAAEQLISSGTPFPWLRGIFISHIHLDHIGGLYAVLGLRHQININTPLTIYGPPQTKTIVDGLLAALAPSAESGFGVPGEKTVPASIGITVIELADGQAVKVDDMTVKVAVNSHYSFPKNSDLAAKYASISYRFDLPDRSIVYTGDTGPSKAVEQLAQGADLLVTEMIDLPYIFQKMRAMSQELTPQKMQNMQRHLGDHHLSLQQIGEMAARAKVGGVVVTHIAGGGDPNGKFRYVKEIEAGFNGPVAIAEDLERF